MLTKDRLPESRRPDAPYAVHSVVALTRAIESPDGPVPAGARGVVHDAKPDGSLYLVEFSAPSFCVIEVPGEALRPA